MREPDVLARDRGLTRLALTSREAEPEKATRMMNSLSCPKGSTLEAQTIQSARQFPVRGLSRLTFWVTNSSLAVLDQGLISGSNFLIGILLARWLPPAHYGAYATAYAVFLLLSFFYQALLLEPQRVFGPSDYSHCERQYLSVLLRVHVVLALAIFLILGVTAWVLHECAPANGLAGALAGVSLAGPCVLLLWLARGGCYVTMSPKYAAAGAAVYCAVVLSGLLFAYRVKVISPFFAFLLIALAALASGILVLSRLGPLVRSSECHMDWRVICAQNWGYGRWILASLGLSWITADLYYPLLSSFSGMAAAGQLKALLNFTLPIAHVFGALALLFLPYASRVLQEKGFAALRRFTWRLIWLFGVGSIVYWACLVVWSKPVLTVLYGGHYTDLACLVPLVAAGSLPWIVTAVPAIILRAVRSPASLFGAYCGSSAIALVTGVPATWAFGLRGALVALALSNVTAMVAALVLVSLKLRVTSVAR